MDDKRIPVLLGWAVRRMGRGPGWSPAPLESAGMDRGAARSWALMEKDLVSEELGLGTLWVSWHAMVTIMADESCVVFIQVQCIG